MSFLFKKKKTLNKTQSLYKLGKMESNSSKITLKIIAGEGDKREYFETSLPQSNLLEEVLQNLKSVKESANDVLTKLVNKEKNMDSNGK